MYFFYDVDAVLIERHRIGRRKYADIVYHARIGFGGAVAFVGHVNDVICKKQSPVFTGNDPQGVFGHFFLQDPRSLSPGEFNRFLFAYRYAFAAADAFRGVYHKRRFAGAYRAGGAERLAATAFHIFFSMMDGSAPECWLIFPPRTYLNWIS